VEISKKDIEEKVKQNFDAYAKDFTTRDDCSKFIKRWGPILDIDDVSQYDEFDSTKFNMFFETMNNFKKNQNKKCDPKDVENSDKTNASADELCEKVNAFITNEYGTYTEVDYYDVDKDTVLENIVDKDIKNYDVDDDEHVMDKTDTTRNHASKVANVERSEALLNIIKNPRTLTGQQLKPTKVLWSLLDREIVTQNKNFKKGAKLSLDECFHKFTEKVLVEKQSERTEQAVVSIQAEMANQALVEGQASDVEQPIVTVQAVMAVKTVAAEQAVIAVQAVMEKEAPLQEQALVADRTGIPTECVKEKAALRETESVVSKQCTVVDQAMVANEALVQEEDVAAEKSSVPEQAMSAVPTGKHKSKLDDSAWVFTKRTTNINSNSNGSDFWSQNKKTSILMNRIGPMTGDCLENSFQEPVIKKEVLSLSIDTIIEARSQPEEPLVAIKTEYLNTEPMSEEYFEDIPSENEMDIKHEKETVIGKIVNETESTPASWLETFTSVKMEAPQLITKEMIGEVYIGNPVQKKRKHAEIQTNEKRRKFNQFSKEAQKDNVEEIINKNFPSDESLPVLQNLKTTNSILDDAHSVVEDPKRDVELAVEVNDAVIKDAYTIVEDIGTLVEHDVAQIKVEPGIDIENNHNPNDPLSVMFVVWNDDNSIDMIEDDFKTKDDLERDIAPSLVRPTTYKPVIPRIKLNTPPLTYQPYTCHKLGPSIRFKKSPIKSEEGGPDNVTRYSMPSPADIKTRQLKRRQCNISQPLQSGLSGPKKKVENLHLVKRRGVFTINRESDSDNSPGQGKRSSKRVGVEGGSICLQLLPGGDECDICPGCKERLSPMALDWRVNIVTGSLNFSCSHCGQHVSVEGMWKGLANGLTKYNNDTSINKIS